MPTSSVGDSMKLMTPRLQAMYRQSEITYLNGSHMGGEMSYCFV